MQELLGSEVIGASQSPFSSLMLLVNKVDETWHLCIDCRALNSSTIKDNFLISVIDEFLVMPLGLTNAPPTLQSLMNEVFKPYLRRFILVFFDDILVYSMSIHDHLQHLKMTLEGVAKASTICQDV